LNRHYGGDSQRNRRLGELGLMFEGGDVRRSDEMFIAEVMRVYFHADDGARPEAELLALARRRAGNGWFTVISQHHGFWRIPLVNVYFIDASQLRGQDDLPAQFDFLRDFGVHRELAHVVRDRVDTKWHGDTVLAAINALRDYVRRRAGLQQDGHSLMEQAFKQDGSHLRVNPLAGADPHNRSQQNEQRGFRQLYCGVWTGLRNPLAHERTDSAFVQTRYPDKRTLLKYLSFLSILFERADGPMP